MVGRGGKGWEWGEYLVMVVVSVSVVCLVGSLCVHVMLVIVMLVGYLPPLGAELFVEVTELTAVLFVCLLVRVN